jgi:hypothetical protein
MGGGVPEAIIQVGRIFELEQAERIAGRLQGGLEGPVRLDFRATQQFERGALAVLAKALRETTRRDVQVLGLTQDNRRLLAYLGVHSEKDASPRVGKDDET